MDAGVLKELETAAQLVMDPQLGTQEQRKAAEALIMNFRKTKNPYQMCRHILDTSTGDLVLFEAADLLKNALVYEWEFLQEQDRVAMRQYLVNYVMTRELKSFVRERILLVVAIMIKRTSIVDSGAERAAILTEFEGVIREGDAKQQYLVCRVLMAMMQEFMTTIKSDDSGLVFEDHFRAKKQFENTSLQKIFLVILKALEKLSETFDGGSTMQLVLSLEYLSIMEVILSWGHITASPTIFSKRLIALVEMAFKVEQTPSLRLSLQWEETMLEPKMVKLFFDMYWKCRSHQEIQSKAANCLVQLATFNGPIMEKKENKVKYVVNYLTNYLQLLSSIELKREEAIPLTAIVRKMLFYNHQPGLEDFPQDLVAATLQRVFQLTCTVAERAVQEDIAASDEDTVYGESFTNLLETWLTILHSKESLPSGVLTPYLLEIFNKYLQCHLTPPDGVRPLDRDQGEMFECDTNDREKFKEQLIIIGRFGREFPQHSLTVLAKLLEAKIHIMREQLQQMHNNLNNEAAVWRIMCGVFEDLQWLLLIAGHVLCTEAEGEKSLIPNEIMEHSIQQLNGGANGGGSDITTSLKLLASPGSSIYEIPNAEQTADHVIRIVAAVLRYCEIEQGAIEAKMLVYLSPEVSMSVVWFLKFWANAYLLPNPENYTNMSESLRSAFGVNTPGGEWTMNYLLKKIYINVQSFTGEIGVIDDSIKLLVSLVSQSHKSDVAFKSEYFKSVVELKNLPLPMVVKSGLLMSLIVTGACIEDKTLMEQYLRELIQPICARFAEITTGATRNDLFFIQKIVYSLNEVRACFEGGGMVTMSFIYESFEPVLKAMVNLLDYLHNSVQIVEIVLELLCKVVQSTFYLNAEETQKIYEICMGVLQVYVKHNTNRFSVTLTEDDNLQDLLLLLKLMNYLLSKNFFEFTDTSGTLDSSEFVIHGLTFLMPMITTDLLKYPDFCLRFYQTIRFFVETKSHKVCILHPDLLRKLLASIEMGLSSFGSEVQSCCLEFLHIMANTVYFDQSPDSFMHSALVPFLKLLLDLILTQQVDSVNKTECSKALFSLICCYRDKFVELVSQIVQSQTNPAHADKLSKEFQELTNSAELVNNRFMQFRFTERFDKFLVNIGFMYSN